MTCAWCKGPIPEGARRDSKFCSQRCRQAAWRFAQGCVATGRAERPMRFGYADPPYPGLAKRYYEGHPDYEGEVDHRELLSRLQPYDGWALSTSAEALPAVLALAVELGLDVRVAAWARGARHVPSSRPLSAWEPVVYAGGRRVVSSTAPSDTLVHVARPRTSDPARVIGAKPAAFAYWLFGLLGARGGDQLDDLFPGSGGIARAWALFQEASLTAADDASILPACDASAPGQLDTSRPPGGDPYRLEHLDASLEASEDASGPPGDDASTLHRGDASRTPGADASPRALPDASARAAHDTSPEYSTDGSSLPRGDGSPWAPEDASCRSLATARR